MGSCPLWHSIVERPRQILVKFATRNVRERVFKARTALKTVYKETKKCLIFTSMMTLPNSELAWLEMRVLSRQMVKSMTLGDNLWQSYDQGQPLTCENYNQT